MEHVEEAGVHSGDSACVIPPPHLSAVVVGRIEDHTRTIAAALDVFPSEPLPLDSQFRKLSNVILSPHVAGRTIECQLRFGETIADEFARFFAGAPLHHQITIDMLPTMA